MHMKRIPTLCDEIHASESGPALCVPSMAALRATQAMKSLTVSGQPNRRVAHRHGIHVSTRRSTVRWHDFGNPGCDPDFHSKA